MPIEVEVDNRLNLQPEQELYIPWKEGVVRGYAPLELGEDLQGLTDVMPSSVFEIRRTVQGIDHWGNQFKIVVRTFRDAEEYNDGLVGIAVECALGAEPADLMVLAEQLLELQRLEDCVKDHATSNVLEFASDFGSANLITETEHCHAWSMSLPGLGITMQPMVQ